MTTNTRQNEIDNEINNASGRDTKIGAGVGGVGGAVTGAVAGSVVGPVGTAVGAVVGGVVGAVASGAAVHAVDKVDDDDTVTGIGQHASREVRAAGSGNGLPGVQTGGRDADGSPDTRGVSEKVADSVTGDRIDDKTGKIAR